MADDKPRARVLLIDDEPSLRRALRRVLEQAGYEIESHPSGEWALGQVRAFGCDHDLVIVDFLLPGMNGVTFIQELGRMCPDIPVILISGYVPDLPEGVPFIQKPFEPRELLERVDALIAGRRITDRAPGGPDADDG